MLKAARPNRLYVTWDEIDQAVESLATQLQFDARFGTVRAIIGIARGGLIVATMLSHKMWPDQAQLPIGALNIQSYIGGVQQDMMIYGNRPFTDLVDKDYVLIVDDLVDGGGTMNAAKAFYPRFLTAVLFGKPDGVPSVDYVIKQVPQDTWIVFPWEKP